MSDEERDREAILARRRHFLALALAGTAVGAASACSCLRMAPPDAVWRSPAVIRLLPATLSAAGATRLIHLPMKSPDDRGSAAGSRAARMPPQRPWPITTMLWTRRLWTANSRAAEVEWNSPSGS